MSGAELLQARAAIGAGAAGIHEAAHADRIAHLELLHAAADGRHPADDLVAGHRRILCEAPFIAGEVEVGVADATVLDLDSERRWRSAGGAR